MENEEMSFGSTTGEELAPAAEEHTGEESTTPAAEGTEETVNVDAEFDALIKGKYKEQFQKHMSKAVSRRVKASKAAEERLKAAESFISKAAARYGKDPMDLEGITSSFDSDDAYWNEKAANEGLTVEQAKHVAELEAHELQRAREQAAQDAQAAVNARVAEWNKQSEELKAIYPDFDFDAELDNPETGDVFAAQLKAGISVSNAYRSIHIDEIVNGTIQQTKEKVVNNIQARGRRPIENGSSSQASAQAKITIDNLTPQQAEELERRAARGEIVRPY